MNARLRLFAIAVLLALSVVVDSVYYLVSALTDALFIAVAVVVALPLVKQVLSRDKEERHD